MNSYIKKLSASNLGKTNTNDHYWVVPANASPLTFYGINPKLKLEKIEITHHDGTSGKKYKTRLHWGKKPKLPYPKGEWRIARVRDFFEDNKLDFDQLKTTKSFYLFDNNSHPDFFYLNDEEKKIGKTIPIENVRKFKNFFYKTDSISRIKIGIIDTIEDLSLNSQNLLLKTIEELPKSSYLFIISNNPVNILKTIKSRCAFFYVNSLCKSDFNKFICDEYKDKSEEELQFINNISFGSPRMAENIIKNNIFVFYKNLLNDLINSDGHLNLRENIVDALNAKGNIFLISVMDLIINDLIQKTIFYIEHQNYIDYTLDKEKELIQKISNNKNTKQIIDLQSQINKNMHLAHEVNLNKSDVLIASLKELSGI